MSLPDFIAAQKDVEAYYATAQQFTSLVREVLLAAIVLCGVHIRILDIFDECLDRMVSQDAGWKMLRATCDQMGSDLLQLLPPDLTDCNLHTTGDPSQLI